MHPIARHCSAYFKQRTSSPLCAMAFGTLSWACRVAQAALAS